MEFSKISPAGDNPVIKDGHVSASGASMELIYPNELHEVTKSFKMKLKGRMGSIKAVGMITVGSDALVFGGREDKIAMVWDFSTGEERIRLTEGHFDAITCLTLLNRENGQTLLCTGCNDGSIVIWDVATYKTYRKIPGNSFGLTSIIAYEGFKSPTSQSKQVFVIATSDNGVLAMWDVDNGKREAVGELEGELCFQALNMFYKPKLDIPFLIVGGSETISVWNLQGHPISVTQESARNLAVCYTSKRADKEKGPVLVWINSEGSSISCMDLLNNKIFTKIDGSGDPFGCLAVIENDSGFQILASCANDIVIYDMTTGNAIENILYVGGHTDEILDMKLVEYDNKSYLLTGSVDNSLCVWRPLIHNETEAPIKTFSNSITDGHSGLVTAVATCNLNDDLTCIITASSDLTAIVWDIETGKQIRKLTGGHTRRIYSVTCFEPKGANTVPMVFTVGGDMAIVKWDISMGIILARITDIHQDVIRSISVFSLDGIHPATVSVGDDFAVGFYYWENSFKELLNDVHMGTICAVDSMVTTIDGVVTSFIVTGSEDKLARVIKNGVLCPTSLTGHASTVIAVNLLDVDTYQKLCITASDDGMILVWDIFTNALVRRMKSTQNSITSMASYFQLDNDPSDQYANRRKYPCVVTGSTDKTACIWDLVTGKRIRIFEGGHSREVSSVSVLVRPNSGVITLITAGYDNSATVWDLQNCELAIPFEGQGHLESILSSQWVGNEFHVTSDCNTIRLWKTADLSLERELIRINVKQEKAHTMNLLATASILEPNNSLPFIVSSSQDGSVILWDPSSQTFSSLDKPAKSPTATINCLCIYQSQPGQTYVIGAGEEKEILVWNLKSRKILKEFPEFHSKTITQIAICKFNDIGAIIITGSKDKTLYAWNFDKKSMIHKFADQHKKAISCIHILRPSSKISLSDDSYWLISCSFDKKCVIWDIKSGKFLKKIAIDNAHKEAVTSLSTIDVTSDASQSILLTGGLDGVIGLWDIYSGDLLYSVFAHVGGVSSLSMSSQVWDERVRLSSCGADCNVQLWDLQQLQPFCSGFTPTPLTSLHVFSGCRRFAAVEMSVYVPIDGGDPIIVSVGDKVLRTTNYHTKRQITAPSELIAKKLTSVNMLSRSQPWALVGNTNGIVEVWNITNFDVKSRYNLCEKLGIPRTAILSVKAYANIEKEATYALAGLENKTAHLWDYEANEPICVLTGHKAPIRAVSFIADNTNSNGKIFAVTSSDDRTAIIWELPNGRKIHKLKDCHLKSVTALATFHNKDGEPFVVTASLDSTAAIWNVLTGDLTKHLKGGHSSAITCVDTFVPSDQRSPIAITGSADRSIVVWHMKKGEKLRYFPDISQEPIAAISIFSDLDGISPIVIVSDKKANLQIRDLYPSTFMPNREDVQRAYEADAAEVEQLVSAAKDQNLGIGFGGASHDDSAVDTWARIAKLSAKHSTGFWLEHGFLFRTAVEENRVDFLVKFKDMLKESLYSLRGVHSLLRLAVEKNSADCVQVVIDCWVSCLPSVCKDMGSQLFWHPSHFLSFDDIELLGSQYPSICSQLICSLPLISSDVSTLAYLVNRTSQTDPVTGETSNKSQSNTAPSNKTPSIKTSNKTQSNKISRVVPTDSDAFVATSHLITDSVEQVELSTTRVVCASLGPSRVCMTKVDNMVSKSIPGIWSEYLKKLPNATNGGQPVVPQFLPLQGAASLDMLALFVSISDELDSPDIFDSTAGSLCLQFAWETVGSWTHLVMLVAYIVFISIYSAAILGNDWLQAEGHKYAAYVLHLLVLAQMAIYFGNQFLQLTSNLWQLDASKLWDFFFGNVWIMQDWISSILVTIGVLIRLINDGDTKESSCILAVGSILVWFKCLYYMRAYEESGPLVAMVLRIAYDIRYFALILGLVLTGFTQAFWLISHHDPDLDFGTLESAFLNAYLYMLGGFSGDFSGTISPSLGQFLLVAFLFFMAIHMLNLLIALMGETFSNVSERKLPQWRWEQAVIILEERKLFNMLHGWYIWLLRLIRPKAETNRENQSSEVIHMLQYAGDVFSDADEVTSIKDIRKDIAQMSDTVDSNLTVPLAKLESKVHGMKDAFDVQLVELKAEMAELKALILSLANNKSDR